MTMNIKIQWTMKIDNPITKKIIPTIDASFKYDDHNLKLIFKLLFKLNIGQALNPFGWLIKINWNKVNNFFLIIWSNHFLPAKKNEF